MNRILAYLRLQYIAKLLHILGMFCSGKLRFMIKKNKIFLPLTFRDFCA